MLPRFSFAQFPGVIATIRKEQRTGCLRCTADGVHFDLFFNTGHMVHATQSPDNVEGDEVLYELLDHKDGELTWNAATTTTQATLRIEDETVFYTTLEALQKRGVFPANQTADLREQESADPPQQSLVPHSPAAYLLPPSSFEEHLDWAETLNHTFFDLHENQFSGYGVATTPDAFALVLFEVGQPTTVRYIGDATLTGQEAFELLTQIVKPQTMSFYRAEQKNLAAFRSLLGGHAAYTNLSAASATLTKLLGAFVRGHHTGTIVVRDSNRTLYYLIHSGTPCGLYAPDAAGRLNLLGDRLNPGPDASLDVYLTRQPEIITLAALPAPQVIQPPTQTELYRRVLRALTHLVGEISSPQHAEDELKALIEANHITYPALAQLEPNITLAGDSPSRIGTTTRLDFGSNKSLRLDAATVSYAINTYLEPYAQRIGVQVMATMVLRTLGDDLAPLQREGVVINLLRSQSTPVKPSSAASDSAFDF